MADQPMSCGTHLEPTSADVERYLHLVHEVVRRMLRRLPPNVRREDLVSAGLVGLYDALRKNGDGAGPQFEWYARIRIRGAVLDELRTQDWLPRRARWIAAGRRPARLGVSTPSAVMGFDDVGAVELAEHLVDCDATDLATQLDHRSDCRSLARAIEQLPDRERTIVRLHYFGGARFKDIGAVLGVSEPRISQLHARAVGRLRATMTATDEAA